jgi:phosphate:Na+ symporter
MGILSSKYTQAVRASVVHVAFNVVGVLLWLPLIWLLVDIAIWISPSSSGMEGTARAAAEVPRQIANANTFFNVINTLLFIGFTGWFARLAEWLVPERAPRKDVIIEPKFLDEAALAAPSVALQQVRLELGRVGDITVGMLQDIRPAFRERDVKRLKDIERRDDEVDILEVEILHYLGKIRQGSLTEEESLEFQGLMMATDNMESLADVIETDLVTLGHKWVELKTAPSDETRKMLIDFHTTILKTVELTVQAIRDNDQRAAESVLMMKGEIREHSERLLARKAERLSVDDPDYLELVRIEMSYVDQMRRIYTLAKRIAKVVLPEVLAQRD